MRVLSPLVFGLGGCTPIKYVGSELLQPDPLRSPVPQQEVLPPDAQALISKNSQYPSQRKASAQCRATRVCTNFLGSTAGSGVVWVLAPASCLTGGARQLEIGADSRCSISKIYNHPQFSTRRSIADGAFNLAVLKADCPSSESINAWRCIPLLSVAPMAGIDSFVIPNGSASTTVAKANARLSGDLLQGYQTLRIKQESPKPCEIPQGTPVYTKPTTHYYLAGLAVERPCTDNRRDLDITLIPANHDWIKQVIIQNHFLQPRRH